MRSDADRLSDILDAIAKIGERIADRIAAFQGDEMLPVWWTSPANPPPAQPHGGPRASRCNLML